MECVANGFVAFVVAYLFGYWMGREIKKTWDINNPPKQ